jgi:predicted RecA/RadA family phage recombinase
MKNYVQAGRMIPVTAPAAVYSGDGVLIGSLFGVAAADADTGAPVELACEGVFTLPKEATTATFAVGAPVEWNAVAKRVDALDTGVQIGVVVQAAGATAATVAVRLTA